MAFFESTGVLLAWGFLLLAGLPILYLFVLTLASFRPDRKQPETDVPTKRIAVVIPARNESLLISDTVSNILKQKYPRESFMVLVIADNCSDDTAEMARENGARVIERHDSPGKGQALHETLELLLGEEWDAFLIIDADSHLHPDTLAALSRAIDAGAKAVQLRVGVLDPGDSIRTLAMELSTASFNALRPRGRTILCLSSGIYNGFCLTREVVMNVPYLAHSIVEDIEYHMLLLKAGYKVAFLDRVWVKSQFPVTPKSSEVQRIRWERGRIIMIKRYAPGLLRDVLKGRVSALDGLLDVMMPPVSLIALSLLPPLLFGTALQFYLAVALSTILYLHYLIAAWRYGSVTAFLRLTIFVPWYILWKTYVLLRSLITERNLPWVRTDRHPHSHLKKR